MGKKLNPALIGAFVIGAVALVVTAAMIWGSGRLFERTDTYAPTFPAR
jgi:paraquat-inducible protein B